MNALECLAKWLEENGYDGLKRPAKKGDRFVLGRDECRCDKNDLQTCNGPMWECEPYKKERKESDEG